MRLVLLKTMKMASKYTHCYKIPRPKCHICNITTSSIARPSKIYPNLDVWFENMPSGNPVPGGF
jgi:hypothetical protein